MNGSPELYFQTALLVVLVEKAEETPEARLRRLEELVAAAMLARYGDAVARARAALERYLADRPGALTQIDVSNALSIVERELGSAEGDWLKFGVPLAALFARSVYMAARSEGDQAWVPDARDVAAADALVREQTAHLETFYEKHLRPGLEAALSAALLTAAPAAALLAVLDDRLPPGASRNDPAARAFPEAYLLGLLAVAATRGQAFGAVSRMGAAGQEFYKLQATVDDKTTAICLYLDQRVFTVAGALEELDAFSMGAETSSWLSVEEIVALGAGEDRGDAVMNNLLRVGGLLLPPFHYNCRTIVVPA